MSSQDDSTTADQARQQAIDLLLYAPVGLLFEGASVLPQLIEKGRSQVSLARMVGRFAVRNRRAEATKVLGQLQEHVAGLLDGLAGAIPVPARPGTRPAAVPSSNGVRPTAPAAARQASRADGPAAKGLAIPDYDSLSASQVVSRLPGLSSTERGAVRRYESAHRGRKTILSKVAQLQGA